jgi:hypothetical protein
MFDAQGVSHIVLITSCSELKHIVYSILRLYQGFEPLNFDESIPFRISGVLKFNKTLKNYFEDFLN